MSQISEIDALIQLVGSESKYLSCYRLLVYLTRTTANFATRITRSLGCFNKLLTVFLGIIKKQLPKELKIWNHQYFPKC